MSEVTGDMWSKLALFSSVIFSLLSQKAWSCIKAWKLQNQSLISVSLYYISVEENEVCTDQWMGGGPIITVLPAKCCTQVLALDTALFVFHWGGNWQADHAVIIPSGPLPFASATCQQVDLLLTSGPGRKHLQLTTDCWGVRALGQNQVLACPFNFSSLFLCLQKIISFNQSIKKVNIQNNVSPLLKEVPQPCSCICSNE